jgi:pimeloyl-ACP methyl ester carboxylesterase
VRATTNGYCWHFDPRIFEHSPMTLDEVAPIACPVAVLRAESGSLDPDMHKRLVRRIGPHTVAFDIPDCGHSVMLDQPFALGSAVHALAGAWSAAQGSNSRQPGISKENQP